MITKEAFKLYCKEINSSYKLCFLPILWDEKKKSFVEGSSQIQRTFWKFNVLILWSYDSFMIFRFLEALIKGETENQIVSLILHLDWIAMFTTVSVVDLTYLRKRKELLQLLNSLMSFNEKMTNELGKGGRGPDILRGFFGFSYASIIANPFATSILIFLNPCGARYFSSIFAEDCKNISFPSMLIFYFIEVYLFTHAVAATYSFIFTVPLVQFGLMYVIKGLLRQPLKNKCCPQLKNQAIIYRQIQILNTQFHSCFQYGFLPAITVTAVVTVVVPLTGLIKLHDILGMAGNCGLPFLAFGGITVLQAMTYMTGRCVKISKFDLMEHWDNADKCCLGKWMAKFRHSCRPIQVRMGSCVSVKTTTILESAHLCIEQTANMILMF